MTYDSNETQTEEITDFKSHFFLPHVDILGCPANQYLVELWLRRNHNTLLKNNSG